MLWKLLVRKKKNVSWCLELWHSRDAGLILNASTASLGDSGHGS